MQTSGRSNDTYRIDFPCAERDQDSCRIAEMTHYGKRGTGFLWCHTHSNVAGTIAYAEEAL